MMTMVFVAALAAAQPQAPPVAATARARATIRILSGVRLRVGAERSEEGHAVERSTMRNADGSRQPAMLVQFE